MHLPLLDHHSIHAQNVYVWWTESYERLHMYLNSGRSSWNDIINKNFVLLLNNSWKNLVKKVLLTRGHWSGNIDLVLRGPRTNHQRLVTPPASKQCRQSSILLLEPKSVSSKVYSGCCSGHWLQKSDGWVGDWMLWYHVILVKVFRVWFDYITLKHKILFIR